LSLQLNNASKDLVNEAVIQEFIEQEAIAQQQVEAAGAKLEAFEAELVRSE
jgi:hypothetical protein